MRLLVSVWGLLDVWVCWVCEYGSVWVWFDWGLFVVVLGFLFIGVLLVWLVIWCSDGDLMFVKYLVNFVIGLVFGGGVVFIDYCGLRVYLLVLYFVFILGLLVVLMFLGFIINGLYLWIVLFVGFLV